MSSRRFFFRFLFLALAASQAAAPLRASPEQEREASLIAMRALDARVAAIGHRLAVAGRDLCRRRAPEPGFLVHHLSQYGADFRPAAARAFGLGEAVAVLAVAPGGAAALAGLRADDALLRADGAPVPVPSPDAPYAEVERAMEFLEAAFADGRATLEVARGSERLSLAVEAPESCATRFQVIPSTDENALADGRYVQITTAMAGLVPDDEELAAILAHELAHNALGHRSRLDAAGVRRGFLGNFGRNARLIRETEVEADRLSVHFLHRADYDPAAAIRFWQRFARRGLNGLASPTHPGWSRRIRLFEAEIAALPRVAPSASLSH